MNYWIPLFSGLIGAIISAAISIFLFWLQAKEQQRINRMQCAIQLAIRENTKNMDIAKYIEQQGGKVNLYPIFPDINYYFAVLDLIETNKLNTKSLDEINSNDEKLRKTIDEMKKCEKIKFRLIV